MIDGSRLPCGGETEWVEECGKFSACLAQVMSCLMEGTTILHDSDFSEESEILDFYVKSSLLFQLY